MTEQKRRISRRSFLKGTGAAAAAGLAVATAGCEPLQPTQPAETEPPRARELWNRQIYDHVPVPPEVAPSAGELRFFTIQEARAVEALTARILPGTPEDPGAREAGVVIYIDRMLAEPDGFAQPAYRAGPYAEVYEGGSPPADSPYDVVWVASDEIERYGYQSTLTPREVYRLGLAATERYSRQRFGSAFAELSEEQQDQIVGALAEDEAEGFEQPTAEAFFLTLRRHTAEGMFSDPLYGGNRGMVGWRLVNYPGAQRGYAPEELRREGHDRQPQGIAELHPFNPGRPDNPSVILPVSGSDLEHHHDAPPRRQP
jgi:gluconate 2-dehydrogenase gamma chain